MTLKWQATHEAEGYKVFDVQYLERHRFFALGPNDIHIEATDGSNSLIHEAYRPLLISLSQDWIPTPQYHTQMEALLAPRSNYVDRWHQNQLADVTIFTDIAELRPMLAKFFVLVDTPEEAGLQLLTKPTEDSQAVALGKVLYLAFTIFGTLQLWDARLPVGVPTAKPQLPKQAFSQALMMLLSLHLSFFGMEKSFIEINPVSLNVSRMFYANV